MNAKNKAALKAEATELVKHGYSEAFIQSKLYCIKTSLNCSIRDIVIAIKLSKSEPLHYRITQRGLNN